MVEKMQYSTPHVSVVMIQEDIVTTSGNGLNVDVWFGNSASPTDGGEFYED